MTSKICFRKLKIVILLVLLVLPLFVFPTKLTDMAGRKVDVPASPKRLVPYDAKTSILVFPCAGSKLLAKGMISGTRFLPYLSEEYKQLPTVDIKNLENVLSFQPDLIIAGAFLPEDPLEKFDKLQSKAGIPVVVVDLSLDKLDETYRFLAELLQADAACEPLISYLQRVYQQVNELKGRKSLSDVSVYYTLGADGLMTDPSGSRHTEVLDYLAVPIAAKIPLPSGGHAQVNLEQIIAWNPDYIFATAFKGDSNPAERILSNPAWKSIKAVQTKKVYVVPGEPYGWFDHPPTVNRICGLIWLSELFYDYSPEQAKADIKLFYRLFYQYDLKDTELTEMM